MKNLRCLRGTVAIRDTAYHLIKGFHDGNMSATYRLYIDMVSYLGAGALKKLIANSFKSKFTVFDYQIH